MAVKTLAEVLAGLSGPEKELFEKTLKANPELADGWTRQDDYSRKMNDLKAKEAEYEEAKSYNDRMKTWADVNVPRWEDLEEKGYINKETGEETVTERLTTLNKELEEAKKQALAGGEMDPAELDRRVQEIVKNAGVLTKEEYAAVAREEAAKLAKEQIDTRFTAEEEKFNKNTIPFVTGFATATAIFANKFTSETGQEWDVEKQKELFEMMGKENNFDAYKVGPKMLERYKSAKQLTDQGEEVKRLREENERLKAGRAGGGLPGGGDEPYIPQPPGKGNIAKMMERQENAPDFESLIMNQARKGAVELAAEGKT
jgi:hypothetical protein